MTTTVSEGASWRPIVRLAWGALSIVLLESVLLSVALLPIMGFVHWQSTWSVTTPVRLALDAIAFAPLYLLFGFTLMVCSALATRLLGWRTADGLHERLSDFSWPVLDWGRGVMAIHVVRVFAGPGFRATPFWSLYMRLNGARIGRLVFVNSLSLMDHNLLDFGDHVVIGSDAHISGHIIERGILKTARVTLQSGTVIGIGSVVGIGVRTGVGTQVGPLSVVPKFTELEAGAAYLGVPVQRIH